MIRSKRDRRSLVHWVEDSITTGNRTFCFQSSQDASNHESTIPASPDTESDRLCVLADRVRAPLLADEDVPPGARTAIAKPLGMSRTVSRRTRNGELDRDLEEPPKYGLRPPVPHNPDPYKAIIDARLAAYPKLSPGAVPRSMSTALRALGRRKSQ